MAYNIKEIFYSLQGEGYHAGRPAIFCRFTGCNLWNGLEKSRESSDCDFCDTDFIGTDGTYGGKYSAAQELADVIRAIWPKNALGKPYVVCTGGEPLLQLDRVLILKLQEYGFEVAAETNGTKSAPKELDWVCVSPKTLDKFIQKSGNEIKLVYPLDYIKPKDVENLGFDHFYLQPLDEGNNSQKNTQTVIGYCLKNPKWHMSLQRHKLLNIR